MSAAELNHPSRWLSWLRACSRDNTSPIRMPAPLGALTGQDCRALGAIAACWHLYASSDDDGARAALEAVRALLPALQPQCRPFARELIAQSLDWPDRERLWPLVSGGSGVTLGVHRSRSDGAAVTDSRLEQLRTAPAAELRGLTPPQTEEELVREWKLLMSMRARALESAALAQLRRSSPALESEAALDQAVELAIGAGHFTWRDSPYTAEALAPLRRQLRCSSEGLRASLERLTQAGRIKQEQLARGDGSVLFVWKRGGP